MTRSLEEEGGPAVEFGGGGECGGVDLGHLEDGDAQADDYEAHNECYYRGDRGFKALEKDLRGIRVNEDTESVAKLSRTIVVSIEKNVT